VASIYIHIPFCKQACYYCDFHFSTSVKYKDRMVSALCAEIELRKAELQEPISSIYFGGGTPSLLSLDEIKQCLTAVYKHYNVVASPEITLEANPDDLSLEKIKALAHSPINRLSIGVQSFFQEDLKLMNRAHSASEAKEVLQHAVNYFKNITIDLIYGIPGMTQQRWKENLAMALSYNIPHISCYALTVEPKTALEKQIQEGKTPPVDDTLSKSHYTILVKTLKEEGFDNYEFSNFGKLGYYSKNNMAYWKGDPYLGIGPSAHSYKKGVRSWNIANNIKYCKQIEANILPSTLETLSITDQYNEYVMTGLRTQWGVSQQEVKQKFGASIEAYFIEQAHILLDKGLLSKKNNALVVSEKGKFLSDGIASDLFLIPLNN